MGRKGYLIPEIIEKNLINGEKTGKELKKLVYNELGYDIPMYFQKSFDHGLIKLLEEEKIKIIGYDDSSDTRKVKQAFKSDPIIFDSSKRLTRPDINNTIKKMNTDKEAYQKIRFLFKSKLKDYNDIEECRWEYLNSVVFSNSAKQIKKLLSHHYDLEKVYNIIENLDEAEEKLLLQYRQKRFEDPNGKFAKILLLFEDTIELQIGSLLTELSYYDEKKLKIWIYPTTPKKFENMSINHPILPKIKKINSISFNQNIVLPNDNKNTYILLYNPYKIDDGGKWTKQNALEHFGFYEPLYVDDFDLAFEYYMDIISTYSDEERVILDKIFAKGLSNEPGSKKIFWELYKRIRKVSYQNRINKILGIFETDTNKSNIKGLYDNLNEQDRNEIRFKTYINQIERTKTIEKPG